MLALLVSLLSIIIIDKCVGWALKCKQKACECDWFSAFYNSCPTGSVLFKLLFKVTRPNIVNVFNYANLIQINAQSQP